MSVNCHNCGEETPIIMEDKSKEVKKVYSKEYLQKLKSIKDEAFRIQNINNLINRIYFDVIRQAETTNNTVYQFNMHRQEIDIKDIPYIITELQNYYTGCIVKYTALVRGRDGKMYDISKMDSSILPFVDINQKNDYIVIDWS
jgi:hypothetical protein